jgi:hypothetical protein
VEVYSTALQKGPGAVWMRRPACCIGDIEPMWKVGDVEPVKVMGAEGYPYGFNVTTEDGKPVVSFAYASRALAEAAATHLESALLNALSVHPHAD